MKNKTTKEEMTFSQRAALEAQRILDEKSAVDYDDTRPNCRCSLRPIMKRKDDKRG